MLKKIAIGLIAVVIVILALATTKPDTFSIERSVKIDAPLAVVYSFIDDFHRWTAWSPWEKMDPGMKRTYSGAEKGVGAIYAWEGNSQVGQGRMEITEANNVTRVALNLDFVTPMETKNKVEFQIGGYNEGSELTWRMTGPSPYISKVMQVFVSMDALLGKDLEAGLADLKAAAEAADVAAKQPQDVVITRFFDASRASVWKAWTDPTFIARWWGPTGYTSPVWRMDFREGGKYLSAIKGADDSMYWATGTYTKIVPQERIEMTDSFADSQGNVVPSSVYGMPGLPEVLHVTLTFEEEGSKTKLTLTHKGVPGGFVDLDRAGWDQSLDKLAATL
ncbi:MAG TPA: SRPBCC domain-containing protein [Steroidobacteraceae bacterium]|nr:SRPBCC domain-containing protein [Steroidobacteraceae bacterium]